MPFSWRRWAAAALGSRSPACVSALGGGLLVFTVSFAVRSLYAVDLAAVLYSHRQPGTRMADRYDDQALAILAGEGVLFPRTPPEPGDTRLLARPPGYPLFLAAVYAALGRGFHGVQLAQNALNSLASVAVFVLAGSLLGSRAALAAGLLAAVAPDLAYNSSLVTPDALGASLVLAAALLARQGAGAARSALAGAALGAAAWLRPNLLLLAPFLGLWTVAISRRRRAALGRAALLAGTAALVIAPITIRNAIVYGQFVPLSTNFGIVLWEGLADAGGPGSVARSRDREVVLQEARLYGDPRYAEWWASPDGIRRDRDRVRRSLGVIVRHPGWFLSAMLGRMAQMLDYAAAPAPFVALAHSAPVLEGERGVAGGEGEDGSPAQAPAEARRPSRISEGAALGIGARLAWARGPVRALQRAFRATTGPLVAAGLAALLALGRRRAFILVAVPVYQLLLQSLMHLEYRVTLPMHGFLIVFAGAAWALAAAGSASAVRLAEARVRRRL